MPNESFPIIHLHQLKKKKLSGRVKYTKHDSAAKFLIFLPSTSITTAAELSRPERSWVLIGLVQLHWPQKGVIRTDL